MYVESYRVKLFVCVYIMLLKMVDSVTDDWLVVLCTCISISLMIDGAESVREQQGAGGGGEGTPGTRGELSTLRKQYFSPVGG